MEPLAGKDTVHDRDVLMCRIRRTAHGDDQNSRLQTLGPSIRPGPTSPGAASFNRPRWSSSGSSMRVRPRNRSPVDMAESQCQRPRHHRRGGGRDVRAAGRVHEFSQVAGDLFLDDPEGAVLVHLGRSKSCSCSGAGPVHGNIAVFIPPCLAGALSIVLFGLARVQPCRLLAVRCDDRDFVGVVAGQMGVDEDKDVSYGGGEREGVFQEGPSMGVCVEDDGQQGGGGVFTFESVVQVK